MAERVGFEPTLEFPLNTLSKRAPSATRPSLHGVNCLLESTIATVFRIPVADEPHCGCASSSLAQTEIVYFRRHVVYSSALLAARFMLRA